MRTTIIVRMSPTFASYMLGSPTLETLFPPQASESECRRAMMPFYVKLTDGRHCADDMDDDLSLGFLLLSCGDPEDQYFTQTYEELLSDLLGSSGKPVRFSRKRSLRKYVPRVHGRRVW